MLSCSSSFNFTNLPERILSTNFLGITSAAGERRSPPAEFEVSARVGGCGRMDGMGTGSCGWDDGMGNGGITAGIGWLKEDGDVATEAIAAAGGGWFPRLRTVKGTKKGGGGDSNKVSGY